MGSSPRSSPARLPHETSRPCQRGLSRRRLFRCRRERVFGCVAPGRKRLLAAISRVLFIRQAEGGVRRTLTSKGTHETASPCATSIGIHPWPAGVWSYRALTVSPRPDHPDRLIAARAYHDPHARVLEWRVLWRSSAAKRKALWFGGFGQTLHLGWPGVDSQLSIAAPGPPATAPRLTQPVVLGAGLEDRAAVRQPGRLRPGLQSRGRTPPRARSHPGRPGIRSQPRAPIPSRLNPDRPRGPAAVAGRRR
jgi:hypothetical protein